MNVEALADDILGHRIQYATYFNDWDTASGQHIYPWTLGCASWDYPLNSMIKITNTRTHKNIIVKVIDRGPNKKQYAQGKIIDLTTAAFAHLADKTDWNAGKMAITIKEVR